MSCGMQLRPRNVQLKCLKSMVCNSAELQLSCAELRLSCAELRLGCGVRLGRVLCNLGRIWAYGRCTRGSIKCLCACGGLSSALRCFYSNVFNVICCTLYVFLCVFTFGHAETWKSKQKQPFPTKSHNITGIQVKSCILEGFWEIRLKRGRVSKKNHWLQNRIISQESR